MRMEKNYPQVYLREFKYKKKKKTKIAKFINTELKSDFRFGVRVRIRVKV